ncbi:MAG: riboflavin kinase [Bacillota bacterium]
METENLFSDVKTDVFIEGRVVSGRKIGRELGFPTANIDSNVSRLSNGVYGAMVILHDRRYFGVMNVGVKPTVDSNSQKTCEIHLLDFQGDIYGENLRCHILFKVREERKFDSLELLTNQIKGDILYAEKRFNSIGYTSAREQDLSNGKRIFKSS